MVCLALGPHHMVVHGASSMRWIFMGEKLEMVADKYNRMLAELSMVSGRNLNKPLEVCCKMTMRCNSRCAHCDIWKKQYGEELTTAQWLRFLSELSKWVGKLNIVFTGGEALLRSDMMTILSHAVRRGFKVELLSNGLIFNDALAARIAAVGLEQITFSFDGIDARTHDAFRGVPGGHAKTVLAVESLVHYRAKYQTDFSILLKTVVNRTNVHQLGDIANWALSHHAENFFQPIEQNYEDDTGDDWYKSSPFWVTDVEPLETEIEKLKLLTAPLGPVRNTADNLAMMVAYFRHPESLMRTIQNHDINTPGRYCRHAVHRFDVSSDGDVRMCFRMTPVGNVGVSSPKTVWENRNTCWAKPCAYR